MIDSQAEKLKELDKEIRPFRQNWEEADSMKSSVESLQNRVTELESVDKTAGQGARNTSKCKHSGLKVLSSAVKREMVSSKWHSCCAWYVKASIMLIFFYFFPPDFFNRKLHNPFVDDVALFPSCFLSLILVFYIAFLSLVLITVLVHCK